jgi:hypothetical protein
MKRGRNAGRILMAVLALLASGCSLYQPVKPYEREVLAGPLMAVSRDPIADAHLQHVFETREGARGATGASGGGCGCN